MATGLSMLFLFSACEEKNVPTTESPSVTLQEAGPIPAIGGEFTVSYTVENPVGGAMVSASVPSEITWISGIDCSVDGQVSMTVSENTEEQERSALMTLAYTYEGGEVEESITLTQSAAEAEDNDTTYMEATAISGTYYAASAEIPVNRFAFILARTDEPVDSEDYYRFVLYSDETPDGGMAPPAGTYTLSTGFNAGTVDADSSFVCTGSDTASPETVGFSECTVTISGEGDLYDYDIRLTDADGMPHRISYSGPVILTDGSGEDEQNYTSTFDSDFTADLTGAEAVATFFGDYSNSGTNNWTLMIMSDTQVFFADIYTSSSYNEDTGLPAGHFTMGTDYAENTFIPGSDASTSSYTYWLGTCFYHRQGYESYIDPKSLITDGTIDITINEDGTYTIVFNCIDDNPTEPHTISGSWTGELGSLYNIQYPPS